MISNVIAINKSNMCGIKKVPNKVSKVNSPSFCGGLNNILELSGSQTSAKIFTNNIEIKALNQIKELCNHPAFKDAPIRIMPDVHPSRNTVVGFSAPVLNGKIIPSIIGSDIGCGMLCVKFDTQGKAIDFDKLDKVISTYISYDRQKLPQALKKISSGFKRELNDMCKKLYQTSGDFQVSRLGSIGSGNHFIEIDKDAAGQTYLIVHTGSRGLGKKLAEHYQFLSRHQNHYYIKELSYLTGDEAQAYLNDLKIAQKYAEANRRAVADEILFRMGWKEKSAFESVHNYISDDGIIRKGAIEATKGKDLLIPLNMRDGVIIGRGKGNPDWNNTAPHGAGRKIARGEARNITSVDNCVKEMKQNGIHTVSINSGTLDEAPQAYKDANEIIENVQDTAEIKEVIKPIFNFKE